MAILRELMGAESPLTSEHLAKVNQVTSRTARSDIKELDAILSKFGAEIKSVRGTGYELIIQDDQLYRKLLSEVFLEDYCLQENLPNLPEERVQFLIKRLLLTEGYIKLEELADELYISKSTIQNDLRDVKKIFKQYDLTLEKRPNFGLKLLGNEFKLRYCMSEYLINRKQIEVDSINARVSILPEEEMVAIRLIILEQIQDHHITMSDIALSNLIIHVTIACKRIQNANYVSFVPQELKDIVKEKEYLVATKIVQKVNERLQVVFPKTEIAYIAIHLLGNKIMTETIINEKEIHKLVGEEMFHLTTTILETIENKLSLGISQDKEFIMGMSLHLKPAINRFRYGMNLRNPLLDAIKSNYPVAFEAGIIAGMVLKQEKDIDIHENEIGYLALHIGAAVERRKMDNQPKRCIIVCSSGVGSAQLLYYKLQAKFRSRLDIVGTTEYYKLSQVPLSSLDFIVSTIPIKDPLPIPVIQVNTILGDNDFGNIERILFESPGPKLEFLKEELVFLQQEHETKEEVLHFLADKLRDLQLVEETFLDSVFEREALSPTCFGNLVAIPHPITPQTDETFWAMCTLQKPIAWEDKRVQIVCLLCVEKNSTSDFRKMYELLVSVIDDSNKVQQLLKCKTYKDFINVFLKGK
jgi:lichenan operon transcriptional antiterminator